MKLSGTHLKRYRQIARLVRKYGRGDLFQTSELDALDDEPLDASAAGDAGPNELADDLEEMGPTFVKIGQVLSGRPDLLPDAYVKALARLQDKVKPFPFDEVERIVAAELGVRISKAFSRFDPEPRAAASLGQVHTAALRDGREVVVKVQRPNIRAQIAEDFEVLGEIARFLDAHTKVGRRYRLTQMLEELRQSIARELDYEREAQNLVTVGANLAQFELLLVPQPIQGYFTRSVLTMEYVKGHKITSINRAAMLETDGAALTEELFKAYLEQILVDGVFHADPHPGNVFLTDDGRIALLDLGMVGHTTPAMQEHLLKVLLALSEGRGDEAAQVVAKFSEKREGFDAMEFERRVSRLIASRNDQSLRHINVGRSVLDLCRIAGETGLIVPSELTLLGKTLMQLDQVGEVLDPSFDPSAAVRRNVTDLVRKRMMKRTTQGGVLATLLEARDFVLGLPPRVNRVLDAITNAELEVNVRSSDAKTVVEGIEKVANRITTGLVLAALIVGAALLMRVETSFRLWGYPGLAILCFLAAASGGFWLVIASVIQDHKKRRRARRG